MWFSAINCSTGLIAEGVEPQDESAATSPVLPALSSPQLLTFEDAFEASTPDRKGPFWLAPVSQLSSPSVDANSSAVSRSPQLGDSPRVSPPDVATTSPAAAHPQDLDHLPASDASADTEEHARPLPVPQAISPTLSYAEPAEDVAAPAAAAEEVLEPEPLQVAPPLIPALDGPEAAGPAPAPALPRWEGIADQLTAAGPAQANPTQPGGNDDAFRFTPRPPEGFADIHRATSRCLCDNLGKVQGLAWDKREGFKLFLSVAGFSATDSRDPSLAPIPHAAQQVVCSFLGHDGPRLSPPHAAVPSRKRHQPPIAHLLWNLSEDDRARLLHQRIIVTEDLTVIVDPYGSAPPTCVSFVKGYQAHAGVDDVVDIARARLGEALPAILDIAERDNDVVANSPDHEGRTAYILRELVVRKLDYKRSGGIPAPQFYVYAPIPIIQHENYDSARHILTRLDWRDEFAGSGRFVRPRAHWCRLCHAADHPRGLCPLPDTPGWLGPPRNPPRRDGGGNPNASDDDDEDDDDDDDERGYRRGRLGGRRRDHDRRRFDGPSHTNDARKRRFPDQDRSERRKHPRFAY
ncbi:hypothetical protein EIP86_010110 [Pleurotus ostreatoroseus]|nr:hypothetical protein EIP86_010110 [Pleurotus ostreatoroseus]